MIPVFANNQLTEVNGREIVVGGGYRIKNLSFNITPIGGSGKSQTATKRGRVEAGRWYDVTLTVSGDSVKAWLDSFYADGTYPHMVQPGMVYISFPTEYGTIYSRAELEGIGDVCKQYGLPLFIDGARLGYGLASPAADVTLQDIAGLCDVFYIGGTKVGALCGEAVVFPKGNAPKHFFTHIKMHGALLAKGRLLGLQFDTLFTDNLYMKISAHAIRMAMKLKTIFAEKGIPFYIDSPTNQQFPILTSSQMAELEGMVAFEIWERLPDGRAVTRFATSWATKEESIKTLQQLIG